MKTYPERDANGEGVIHFEFDAIYIAVADVVRILSTVPGVSDVVRRKPFGPWNYVHVWFQFRERKCVVWEPHGDNSRYWLGPEDGAEPIDLTEVQNAFAKFHPNGLRLAVGNLITMQWLPGRNS